jgi:hypothetical protein
MVVTIILFRTRDDFLAIPGPENRPPDNGPEIAETLARAAEPDAKPAHVGDSLPPPVSLNKSQNSSTPTTPAGGSEVQKVAPWRLRRLFTSV